MAIALLPAVVKNDDKGDGRPGTFRTCVAFSQRFRGVDGRFVGNVVRTSSKQTT